MFPGFGAPRIAQSWRFICGELRKFQMSYRPPVTPFGIGCGEAVRQSRSGTCAVSIPAPTALVVRRFGRSLWSDKKEDVFAARRADRRVRRGLSTITTKRTRHLSQPPIQHTRQPSIRSPRATGLSKRRKLVSTSMAPMHVSDGRDSQGGQGAVVHFLTEGKPRPRAPHGRPCSA